MGLGPDQGIGVFFCFSPVREGAVGASQFRGLAILRRLRSGCFFVELDAEPRDVRREKIAVLERDLNGNHVRHLGARPDRQFLDAEVGDSQAEMKAGRRGDRSQGIVRCDVDVVGFAPVRDLAASVSPPTMQTSMRA